MLNSTEYHPLQHNSNSNSKQEYTPNFNFQLLLVLNWAVSLLV